MNCRKHFILGMLCTLYESKKGGKDQELTKSSTIPDPGYHMGK